MAGFAGTGPPALTAASGLNIIKPMGPAIPHEEEPQTEPEVEITTSETAESLLSIHLVVVGDGKLGEMRVATDWLDEVETKTSSDLRRRIAVFRSADPAGKVWHALLGLAAEGPHDLAATIRRVRQMPAAELWRIMLGLRSRYRPPAPLVEAIDEAGNGDIAALDRHAEAAWRVAVARAFQCDAPAAHEAVVTTLERWRDEVFDERWAAIGPGLEREAAHIRQAAAGQTAARVYERATRGVEYVPELGVDRLLLAPTWVGRPWVSHGRLGATLVVCYPAAEEALVASEEEAAMLRVVRLAKALADEKRVQALRHMAGHECSLQELADHLGLHKSTMHHHLAMLRGLGFLHTRVATKRYRLRPEALTELPEVLQGYLGAGPARPRRRRR